MFHTKKASFLIIFSVVASMALAALSLSFAAADNKPGCYQPSGTSGTSFNSVACPSNSTDTNNQPLDPAQYCYVPSGIKASSQSIWQQVDCTDLTTPAVIATGNGSHPKYSCGSGSGLVYTSINIGCQGNACNTGNPKYNAKAVDPFCSTEHNAITDAVFAIIRFLSDGVGLVIIGSVIVGGIQYSASSGDPQASSKAVERIRSSIIALIIFIFAYAIINYLIPKGFFQ